MEAFFKFGLQSRIGIRNAYSRQMKTSWGGWRATHRRALLMQNELIGSLPVVNLNSIIVSSAHVSSVPTLVNTLAARTEGQVVYARGFQLAFASITTINWKNDDREGGSTT